jgi:glycosyltransferase involved in cell wall biosynthesis
LPTTSILLPVFNAAPWLHACLQSIQQQSISDWELLAVNDHSTDNSLSILNDFAKADTRIKVFQNKDKGIIPALRLAFEKSSGPFITRMDADDVMAARKLEALTNLLLKNGRGHVATGLVKYIADTPLGDGYLRYEKWLNTLCDKNNHYEDIYRECVIPSPCWMVHREDLIRSGAFLPDRYPEDYDLCFRFYENKLKVLSEKEVLHFWRDHSGRTSRNSETYAVQHYFDLKLPWFLQLDYTADKPLVLWGTGKKGKVLAQKLLAEKTPFTWVTNNLKKQGIAIYNVTTASHELVSALVHPQIMVAVASPEDQKAIRLFCSKLEGAVELYFFC